MNNISEIAKRKVSAGMLVVKVTENGYSGGAYIVTAVYENGVYLRGFEENGTKLIPFENIRPCRVFETDFGQCLMACEWDDEFIPAYWNENAMK